MHSRNSYRVLLSALNVLEAYQFDKVIANGNDDTG